MEARNCSAYEGLIGTWVVLISTKCSCGARAGWSLHNPQLKEKENRPTQECSKGRRTLSSGNGGSGSPLGWNTAKKGGTCWKDGPWAVGRTTWENSLCPCAPAQGRAADRGCDNTQRRWPPQSLALSFRAACAHSQHHPLWAIVYDLEKGRSPRWPWLRFWPIKRGVRDSLIYTIQKGDVSCILVFVEQPIPTLIINLEVSPGFVSNTSQHWRKFLLQCPSNLEQEFLLWLSS